MKLIQGGYHQFLKQKAMKHIATGIPEDVNISDMLFPFQKDIVSWALKKGRACIFADCGLGKTPMQLEWASHIPGDVLILAPLGVSKQTVREGDKFGIPVKYCQHERETEPGITITNYERLDNFVTAVLHHCNGLTREVRDENGHYHIAYH